MAAQTDYFRKAVYTECLGQSLQSIRHSINIDRRKDLGLSNASVKAERRGVAQFNVGRGRSLVWKAQLHSTNNCLLGLIWERAELFGARGSSCANLN